MSREVLKPWFAGLKPEKVENSLGLLMDTLQKELCLEIEISPTVRGLEHTNLPSMSSQSSQSVQYSGLRQKRFRILCDYVWHVAEGFIRA